MLSFSFIVFSNFSSDFFPDPLGIWEYLHMCTFSQFPSVIVFQVHFIMVREDTLYDLKIFKYIDLFCSLKVKVLVAQSHPTLQPHGLQPTRLLRPWDFPGKSTGVGWIVEALCLCYSVDNYMGLLDIWNVLSATEEQNFTFYLILI